MEKFTQFTIGTYAAWIILAMVVLSMYGCPKWNVWRSQLAGRAEFLRAEQNRLIQIEEAKANLASQKLNSQAEVERAKGMAKSIEIENGKLTKEYIQYLWVRNLDRLDGAKVIYIPTEAGLPILEAKAEINNTLNPQPHE